MTEDISYTVARFELLTMRKVLEGLIHNINTPLNVIIGYSQQLKKKYPEITQLEFISDAGLKIDDLVQSCIGHITGELLSEVKETDLKLWLQNEHKYMMNFLDVKHSVVINVKVPDDEVTVETNTVLLGLLMESIVLKAIKANEVMAGNNIINITLKSNNDAAILTLCFPENQSFNQNLETYLSHLTSSFGQYQKQTGSVKNLFITECQTNTIKVIINPMRQL